MDRDFTKFPDVNIKRPDNNKDKGPLQLSYIKYPELLAFSYYTNLDLSLSTLGMESTINLQNTSAGKYLKPNTFGISLIDTRQNHETFKKRDMNYNNLFLINDSKKIYPLSYTLLDSKENINNALYVKNNKVSINIDNYYIKERNSYIYGDYTHLRDSSNFSGFFKPDNISTEISNNNGISIKSTYMDLMDNIKNVNVDINLQLAEEITYIPKFRIMYGSSLSDGFTLKLNKLNLGDLTYKDKDRSINVSSTDSPLYIDYGTNNFYLIYKILFTYVCNEKLYKYFMFNKNDINVNLDKYIKIWTTGGFKEGSTLEKEIISYNINKSFVYDITYNEYNNGTVNGYFYLALYFDINLSNLKNNDIIEIKKHGQFEFQPIIKINGYENELPYTYIYKLVDEFNDIQVTKRLYHDYVVGYNFEHHGNYIGTCILPSNFYKNVQDKNIASNKPIFVYKKILTDYSTNIFSKIHSYRNSLNSLDISLILTTNKIFGYSGSQIIDNNETNPIKFKYPNINYGGFTNIAQFMNHFITINGNTSIGNGTELNNGKYFNLETLYCTSVDPNDAFSPKKTFTNNIQDGIITNIFNNFNKDFGNENGLRINDIYIPNIFELQFIKLIKEFNNKYHNYYSSTILSENNKYYVLGIKKNTTNIISLEYKNTEISPMNFVCYFKIPDINVLNGNRYHIMYSRLYNYECIDYFYTKNQNIIINIQKNYPIEINSIDYQIVKGTGSCGGVYISEGSNGSSISLNYEPTSLNSEILVYYIDSDYSLNNYTLKNKLGTTIHCRILCKISVKYKSTF